MKDYIIKRKVTQVITKVLQRDGETETYILRVSGHRKQRLKTDVAKELSKIYSYKPKFQVLETKFVWEYVSVPEHIVEEYGMLLKEVKVQ